MPTITRKDVAKKAGVSEATISRVMNNYPHVKNSIRRRVLSTARELDYFPNGIARALAMQKSGNIGFVLPDKMKQGIWNPFYSKELEGVEQEAQRHNYHLIFSFLKEHSHKIPSDVDGKKVDGILLVGNIEKDVIFMLKEKEIPLVLVDNRIEEGNVNCVVIDNIQGAREATEHLIRLGHKNISFLGGELSIPSIKERFAGYKQVLREAGMAYPQPIRTNGLNFEDGYKAMRKILPSNLSMSAVFAANDSLAAGAMKAIMQKGLRIPEDISVVGFDDIDLAFQIHPGVTTVRVPKQKMGQMATKRLLEIIKDKKQKPVDLTVSVELVIRESTGRPYPESK